MFEDLSYIKPEGLSLLHSHAYTQWVKDNTLYVLLQDPLSFYEEQKMFSLGWKKANNCWRYNLSYAYIMGAGNEQKS